MHVATKRSAAGGALVALAVSLIFAAGLVSGVGTAHADSVVFDDQALSIDGTESTQLGRETRAGAVNASTCGAARSAPGLFNTTAVPYDEETFANITTTPQCLTATTHVATSPGCASGIFTTAYMGFDPANPNNNYLADGGGSPLAGGADESFGMDVAPQGYADVVTAAVNAGTCAQYGLHVTSVNPWGFNPSSVKPGTDPLQLITTPGTWSTPVPTVASAWQRCNTSGASCVAIPGAGTASYTVTPADVGTRPRVVETATEGVHQSTVNGSVMSTPIASLAPAATLTATKVAGGGTLATATDLVPGSRCDDCSNTVTFPFPVTVGGRTFSDAKASSNGTLTFDAATVTGTPFSNTALPAAALQTTLAPFWNDLRTDSVADEGIFTGTSGTAPNRTFAILWRAQPFGSGAEGSFEILLREDSPTVTYVYGPAIPGGSTSGATVGLQLAQVAPFAVQSGLNDAATAAAGDRIDITQATASISGTAQQGQTLTAGDPGFFAAPGTTVTHQWRSCDASGATCTDIAGATGGTYIPVAGDVGHALRVAVIAASGGFGSTSVVSGATGAVAAAPAPPVVPPVVPPATPPKPDTTPPSFSLARFTASSVKLGKPATLTLKTSEGSTVTATVSLAQKGRKLRGKCVKATPKLIKAKAAKCTRYKLIGSVSAKVPAGALKKVLVGPKVAGRKLAKGTYRIVLVAKDAAGNRSKVKTLSLVVR